MKRQRARVGGMKPKLPCMVFTLDQLVLLRKALTVVEQVIQAQRKPDPKLPFAMETTLQVQAKVQEMISQGVWGIGRGFDYNEMIILRTAVWMYLAGLTIAAPTPEAEKERRIAQLLNAVLNANQTQKNKLN